ncbi:hypothetical protein G3N59_32745 [Paraburkholderia sp. Ac-20340]|uniref:hypothetical protein n=1 Tax=unclassified Paraburkholderia TaxID=2615204 RepID=UPI0019815EF8|nr:MULTISPECIES: hypothetical protein [unclassified Paraburkholderia]MBN3858166.1 hypothetical protein [Paraburkholderia sp. Ac-20340]
MKRIALSLSCCLCVAALAYAPAGVGATLGNDAGCSGSLAFPNCIDASGNNYSVQHFGNTAPVNEKPPMTGGASDRVPTTIGSSTYVSGVAADGATWNESVTDYGNGTRTISGMDGNGVVYTHYCTLNGCN